MAKTKRPASHEEERPTVAELRGGHPFSRIAQTHWISSSRSNPTVVTEIWRALESEGFHYKSLVVLENLRFLEEYVSLSCSDSLLTLQLSMASFQ
jgi:intron-binding protein aquarius